MRHPRSVVASLLISYAVLGAANAGELSVWAAPEGYKIDRFGKKIFTLDKSLDLAVLKKKNGIYDAATQTISVAGARGETTAFQLGIEGGEVGAANVNAVASPLAGPNGQSIPASTVSLYKIYYTLMNDKGSGPTNGPTMGQGWYPDALVPWEIGDTTEFGGYDGPPFAIKAGEIQGVWIDLAIPYGTAAGNYSGTLTVSSEGGKRELKLALHVYDFDIPRQIHNTFFMNFGIDNLSQAGGYWLKGDMAMAYEDDVYRLARRHRFTAGNMYEENRPTIEETADGLGKVDWTAYDQRWGKVLDPKKNVFGPGEPPIEIWKAPLFAMMGGPWPVNPKAWDQMIVEIKKHWHDKGWDLSKAYVYLADEPGKEVADKLNDYAQRVKKSPGDPLRRQIAVYTILGEQWATQKWVFDLWKDNLDMWMVAGDYYQPSSMDAMPKTNLKGMYQGGEPFEGNETLDADGVAMRTWSWIAWQYRIDYLCYYAMDEAWRGFPGKKTYEHCEIWDTPRNRGWGISQGVFIYPGRRVNYDHPIVNIRMKQIRRGQTDFEYFWLLKQAGQGELADSLVKGVIHKAVAEAAPAPGQYSAGQWSHNPAEWDAALQQAAAKLEALKDALPKEKAPAP